MTCAQHTLQTGPAPPVCKLVVVIANEAAVDSVDWEGVHAYLQVVCDLLHMPLCPLERLLTEITNPRTEPCTLYMPIMFAKLRSSRLDCTWRLSSAPAPLHSSQSWTATTANTQRMRPLKPISTSTRQLGPEENQEMTTAFQWALSSATTLAARSLTVLVLKGTRLTAYRQWLKHPLVRFCMEVPASALVSPPVDTPQLIQVRQAGGRYS